MEHSKHTNQQDMKHGNHSSGKGHQGHGSHHAHMVADFRKRFWISLAATIPILVLSPMIQAFLGLKQAFGFPGDAYILWGFSTFVFFYGGWPFLKGLFEELQQKNPGMMTLIAVAITTAYAYSSVVVFGLEGKVFFWELATLIDIMLLGHWIEMKSVMGASRALEELARLMPSDAHKVMEDGSTQDVSIEELEPGDKVLVKPGEKVPVDGEVIEGESAVNEAMLTGESRPVAKERGSRVIGGSINGEGSITAEVQKTGQDSFLSQMIELVEQAQQSKSRSQDLANRAALWLTVIALSCGAVTFVIWLGLMSRDFAFSLERTVTVMVITCPHALGLAVPLVVAVSTALSAKNGLLIRDRASFERGRNIQAIVFDKTGTLTKGEFGVTDTLALAEGVTEDDLLQYAAAVESNSEHPIAKGIAASVEKPPRVEDFQAIPGKGAQGRVEGKEVKIVSPGYLQDNDIAIQDDQLVVDGEPKDYTFEVLREGYVSMLVDGKSLPVSVEAIGENTLRVTIGGRRTEVQVKDERDLLVEEFGLGDDAAAGGEVRAPMPGLVLDVLVEEGDEVAAEQGLLVLEAMKMENELKAPSGGIVTAIHATGGDAVEKDALLIAIEGQE